MQFQYTIISEDSDLIGMLLELPDQFEDFVCVGYTGNEEKAYEHILKLQPQIVFLDLDSKNLTDPFGFVNQLFQYLEVLPKIVAISQSKENAYKAIKNNFFDYLLKPSLKIELRKCLMSLKKKHKGPGQLCLKSYSDYQFLTLSEIVYLKADNNTTDFYLNSGGKVVGFKGLKIYESLLPANFLRVHKSYVINSSFIRRISFSKNKLSLRIFSGLVEIPFSKSYANQINSLRSALISETLSFSET